MGWVSITRGLVCLVLVFAPWAFGSTELWSLITVQALVGLAFVLTLISLWSEPVSRRCVWNRAWAGPLLLLPVYIGVQAANASHHYQALDQGLIPQEHLPWLPHSVDAAITWHALGALLMYGVLFWTVQAVFHRASHWKTLLTVLVINGFVMAVFAMVQHVSGTRKIFWLRTPTYPSDFLGPFVNPDNYAAYMNLLLPICLARGRQVQCSGTHRRGGHPGFLFYFMAAVMFASIVISNSRAAIVIAVVLVVCWVLLEFFRSRRAGRKTAVPWLSVGVLVGGAALVLCLTGFGPTRHKLVSLEMAVHDWRDRRVVAYEATGRMFLDHWPFGVGAGAFPYAFPYYQPDSLHGFWRYAHNDWIQYLAELGVAGTVLVAAFGVTALRPRADSQSKTQNADMLALRQQPLVTVMFLSLGGLAIHACVDFPLHIPGVTCQAIAYVALLSLHLNAK